MRHAIITGCAALALLVAPRAVKAQSDGSCPSNDPYYPEHCFGHILVRAGSLRWPVFVDGRPVGVTPVLVTIDHHPVYRVEVRPPDAPAVQRHVRPRRGHIVVFDLTRPPDLLAPTTHARFYDFDECSGFSTSSVLHAEEMDLFAMRVFRDHMPAADAARLPTVAAMMAHHEARCRHGDGHSCGLVGRALERGDQGEGTIDQTAAVDRWTQGCALRDASSCAALGRAYAYGQGVTADPVEAARRYQQACDLGDVDTCRELARRRALGDP